MVGSATKGGALREQGAPENRDGPPRCWNWRGSRRRPVYTQGTQTTYNQGGWQVQGTRVLDLDESGIRSGRN